MNADLHIHTCLSPCGDLDMSPGNIIRKARDKGLQVISITDHNSTLNVQVCIELGEENGVFVIPGCEVNTDEEVHCLCYFPNMDAINRFQLYLDSKMRNFEIDTNRFGCQVAVDKNDVIIYEEKRSLFLGISDGIDKLEKVVHELDGIFVPAHIDKLKNSIYSQLGFIPPNLRYDALEISRNITVEKFIRLHPELTNARFLTNSDAHYIEGIGAVCNKLEMKSTDWESFKNAIYG